MSKSELELTLAETIKELELNGDLVVTTTTPNAIVNKLVEAISKLYPVNLSEIELSAVKNAVNITCNGFKLDDWDFQTHIGLTKNELKVVLNKLGKAV